MPESLSVKRIAIVILNWNGQEFLRRFLPGVIAHSTELARIIVADNASSDNSIAILNNEFPEVETIVLDQNYGFTGGYNRALDQVASEYYLLLNSDVEVTEGWLSPMLGWMDTHPESAACQPKIRSYHDRHLLEHAGAAGGYIDALGYPFCRGRILNTLEEDTGQYEDTRPVFWATGACMLIRSADFKNQGGFDERFFAHMEEIDLCWRLQRANRMIHVVPQSTVYHVGGGTLPKKSPRKTFFNFRNNLLMLSKNLPLSTLLWLIPIRLLLDGVAGVKFLLDGDHKDTLAVIRAHFGFYRLTFISGSHSSSSSKPPRKRQVPGLYNGSILLDYYLKKRRRFSELDPKRINH